MKFSIITVAYNAQRYIAQTLQSVATQKGADFEHLIWDGGSVDETVKIARSFPHTKVLCGKDRGIADAMNLATEEAKGDFLLFLHADDLLPHSKVLSMVHRSLTLHPHVEWLYGRANMIDASGSLLQVTPYEAYTGKRLRKYNFLTHPATLLSKSLFKSIGGFRAQLRYCMDYDLWLRLARFHTPFLVPMVLASFRCHNGSLSISQPLKVADEAYLVRNHYVTSYYERYRSYRTWKRRRNQLLENE